MSQYSDAVMALTPSMYWRLGEPSGTTAEDQTANNRDGTYGSGVTLAQPGLLTGDSDTAVLFDGTTNARVTSSYNPFANGTSRTFTGWTNRSSATAEDELFVSDGTNLCYLRIDSGSTTMRFDSNASAGTSVTWASAWPGNGVRVFWALVFNESTDSVTLYINGTSQGGLTLTDAYGATPGNFKLGASVAVAGFMSCTHDEIAVFESALSGTDILGLWTAGTTEPPPPAPNIPARVVSQPVDDRLFVELTHANGRKSRWGPDEPDASGIPTGISFGNTAPGGHRDFNCGLVRDPRSEWPDLDLFDDLRCYGRVSPLGRSAFEGQQEGFPSELGDRFGIGVTSVGYQALLEDDESFVGFYLDRDVSHWQPATLSRQAALAGSGIPQGKIPVQIDQGGIVWNPPNEQLPQNEDTEVMYICPSGKTVAKLLYKGARTGTWTSFEAATLRTDDNEAFTSSATASLTLDDTVRTATAGSVERYLMLRAQWTAAAGTPAAGVQQRYSALGVVGNHGLTTRSISGDLDGLYGHDILHHALSQAAPLLQHDIGGSLYEATDFVIPDLALLDPAPVSELVQKLNAYYLYPWAVWDDRRFWWRPWDQSLTWKARIQGGAHWSPAGRQGSTLVNGVVVQYSDHIGARKTAGPPGSGCDDESSRLEDTNTANPVNSHGRRRWQRLDVGFPLTSGASGSAVQLGYVWLQEHLLPQRRGQLTVRPLGTGHVPQIEHPTLGPVPVWAVRAGDFVDLVDFPDREPFKVISANYQHDSKTLTCELDNTMFKLGAILERVGIRQAGRI